MHLQTTTTPPRSSRQSGAGLMMRRSNFCRPRSARCTTESTGKLGILSRSSPPTGFVLVVGAFARTKEKKRCPRGRLSLLLHRCPHPYLRPPPRSRRCLLHPLRRIVRECRPQAPPMYPPATLSACTRWSAGRPRPCGLLSSLVALLSRVPRAPPCARTPARDLGRDLVTQRIALVLHVPLVRLPRIPVRVVLRLRPRSDRSGRCPRCSPSYRAATKVSRCRLFPNL